MLHYKTNYNVNVKEQFARKNFLTKDQLQGKQVPPSGVTPALWRYVHLLCVPASTIKSTYTSIKEYRGVTLQYGCFLQSLTANKL